MKALPPHKSVRLAAGALAAILMASYPMAELRADTIDWAGGAGENWSTQANWVGGVLPANDLTSDIARFNTAILGNINTTADRSINGIEFGDGGETTIGDATLHLGWAGRTLKIGSGGLNLHTNAGSVSFREGIVQLVGDQTFTHNGTGNLDFNNRVDAFGTSGLVNLTLRGTGTTRFLGVVADAADGATLGMTIDTGTGTVRLQNNANTFSGTINLLSGVLDARGTESLGTGTMNIGATSGSANAVLQTVGATNIRRSITFNAGSSGTAAIEQAGSATTFSGTITLNRDASLITKTGNGIMTFDGNIGGTGNLTFLADGGTGALIFRNGKLNMSGQFIYQSPTATTIRGGIGSNVTRIFHNGTGPSHGLTIENGNLEVNTNGTLLETNSGALNAMQFQNEAGVTGTGDLILKNDSSLIVSTRGVGIFFTNTAGVVNNTGKIVNRGVGTGTSGTVRLNSGVGPNVTAIIQESSTSVVAISNGVLTVNSSGTLLQNTGGASITLSTSNNGLAGYQIRGTGDLLLENNTSVNDAITISNATNPTNPPSIVGGIDNDGYLINQGSGTGRVRVEANFGSNLKGIIQDSATSTLYMHNSYNNSMRGTVEVRKGILDLGNAGFNSHFDKNEITVAAGARINFLASTGAAVHLGSLNGDGTIHSSGVNVSYNVGGANANGAFSGDFITSASGNVTYRMTKTGTGIQEIEGALANFVAVTVDEGTYQVRTDHTSGISATGTGPVTVKSDAALAGIGVIRPTSNAVTIQSGGILAPGDRLRSELGTLVIDGGAAGRSMLTMEEGATFSFRISYDADQDLFLSDQLHLWNLTGITEPIFNDNEVVISTLGEVALGNYRLFSFYEDDGYWEAFYGANLQLSFAEAGIEGYLADTFGGIDLVITKITPIPEPSTWAMLLGGMAGMQLLTRRARSRKNLHKKVS